MAEDRPQVSRYPARLAVSVTNRSLRLRATKNPLDEVVTEALRGIPHTHFIATKDSVTIWDDRFRFAHAARYWVPDDLWKLMERHANGQRVKPGEFELELVFARDRYSSLRGITSLRCWLYQLQGRKQEQENASEHARS